MADLHSRRRALAQFIGATPPKAATPAVDAQSLFGRVMAMLNDDLTLGRLVAAFEREDLGRERIAQLAAETGLSYPTALRELTEMLPTIVDKLTPMGELSKGLLHPKPTPLNRTPDA